MAQSGYTPLSLYYSATAATAPLAANLVAGELALNTNDGKLYYKDSAGVVQVLASKTGNVNVSSFSGGTTGLTPSTATTGVVTLAGTLAQVNGGTGFSTYTTGDTVYASASNTLSKLAIGSTGQILRVVGGVPAWGTDYVGTVTSVSGTGTVNGLTLTGTVTSSGSLTLGGTLDLSSPPAIGGTSASTGKFTSLTDTGLTSGRVTYATTGGLLTDSANLTFNGTTLTLANDASISGLTVGKGGGAVATSTAFGLSALASGSNTGVDQVAIGRLALTANTSGGYNTSVGSASLYTNTTGSNNVSVGYASLFLNTTGGNNTAMGGSALYSNTTASNNTAVGYQAGYSNTANSSNVFVGYQAGYSYNTTGSGYNCIVGPFAGYNLTTGTGNTFVGAAGVGFQSGGAITTGSKNTILGSYSGNGGGLDIRTASNYIVLSDGDGNPRLIITSAGSVGIGNAGDSTVRLTTTGSDSTSSNYAFRAENSGTFALFYARNDGVINTGARTYSPYNLTTGSAANMYVDSAGTLYRSTSSLKYKTDVQDATHGLADLLKLRSVTYKQKNSDADGNKSEIVFGGLIAEEVDAVGLTEFVQYAEDGTPDALAYSNMVSLCVKAIQELKAEVDSLKQQLGK